MRNVLKIILSINLLSVSSWAIIPLEQKELDPSQVPTLPATQPTITSKDVSRVIPTDMPETTDASDVGRRIADKGMDAFMNSDAIKNTGVAKAAKALNVDKSMVIGSSSNGIEHKVGLRLLALQSTARLEYSGFVDANATYSASSQSVDLNVIHPISKTAKMLVNMNTQNQIETFQIKWDW